MKTTLLKRRLDKIAPSSSSSSEDERRFQFSWKIAHLSQGEHRQAIDILRELHGGRPSGLPDPKATFQKLMAVMEERADNDSPILKSEWLQKERRREELRTLHRQYTEQDVKEIHELDRWFEEHSVYDPATGKFSAPTIKPY